MPLDSPTRLVLWEYSDIQTKGPPGRSFRDMELELVSSVNKVTPLDPSLLTSERTSRSSALRKITQSITWDSQNKAAVF